VLSNVSIVVQTQISLLKCTASQKPDLLNKKLQNIPDNEDEKLPAVKLKNGKERQRVAEVSLSKSDFTERMPEAFKEFESHTHRVKDNTMQSKS
jgi:hypothetical protein